MEEVHLMDPTGFPSLAWDDEVFAASLLIHIAYFWVPDLCHIP